jgi:DNA-binding GntR family transcriptional regulator
MSDPGWPPEIDRQIGSQETKLRGQRVAASIRAEILDGRLAPGSRVRQEELASRLGSSRIPIREALRQLESEGLVVLVANSGAWIAKLDLTECVEIYKVRERLEPLALAESVVRLSSQHMGELERLVDAIEGSGNVDDFLRLDRDFHLLSYRGASLPMLRSMILRFWNTTQHYRRAYHMVLGQSNQWIIHAEHRLMLEAIRRRDVEESERTLHSHIRRTRLELSRHTELFQ